MQRGGVVVWRGEYTDASGLRRRVQLGLNKADAQYRLSKLIRERDLERAGVSIERGQDLSLQRLAWSYLADLRSRARPRYYETARYTLESTLKRLPARTVRECTRPLLLLYQRTRIEQGRARSTVNAEIGALRAALAWGLRSGLIAANPLAGLRLLPTTAEHRRRLARALTENEIERLLAAAGELDHELGAYPRAPLLTCLAETGARWAELTSVTWGDVDLEREVLVLQAGSTKTGSRRVIPLSPPAIASLRRLWEAAAMLGPAGRAPGSKVFRRADGEPWPEATSVARKFLNQALRRAGIPRLTPDGRVNLHALRHTFVTRLARAGVPVQHAQALTGHRTASILMSTYTHLGVDDLRVAISRISSPGLGTGEGPRY